MKQTLSFQSKKIFERNDNFELNVFNLDEAFGQLPCKNVLGVFQSVILRICSVEALIFCLMAASGQVGTSVPPFDLIFVIQLEKSIF